jgi:hypothetical protein
MPKLTLKPDTHTYYLDGKRLPGVTEIMACVGARKTPDDPWRSVCGSEFIVGGDTSRNFGHALHAIAAMKIKGKIFTSDPQMQPWINGLDKFFADNPELKTYQRNGVFAVESMVWSRYGFAGTFDWLAETTRALYLIDWKSCTSPMDHHHMQTAAYEQAIRERYDIPRKPMHRWPVRIMENDYRIDRRRGHPEDWHNFLSILNTYKLAA